MRRASCDHAAGDAPTHIQDICVPGNLPLLPADVGIPHYPVPVDDEKAGPLTHGDDPALHLVEVIDPVLGIEQARERDAIPLEVGKRAIGGVTEYRDYLCPRIDELPVLLRQPAKLPAAEGSKEAAQEHQDNASAPPVVAQGDLSSRDGLKCEVRCHGAYWHARDGDRHALLPIFFGEINQKNVALKQ